MLPAGFRGECLIIRTESGDEFVLHVTPGIVHDIPDGCPPTRAATLISSEEEACAGLITAR